MAQEPFAYVTKGGIAVSRTSDPTPYDDAVSRYLDLLDRQRGAVFSSNYEFPGRYTRWDTAMVNPPLVIESRGRSMTIRALNDRGQIMCPWIAEAVGHDDNVISADFADGVIRIEIAEPSVQLPEEQRSRMPTVFSVLRVIVDLFRSDEDANIGLYGAFGYDLAFQFDHIDIKLERPDDQRDIVLYLPDEILMVDHHNAIAWHDRYEFSFAGHSTAGLARNGQIEPFENVAEAPRQSDHKPGEFARLVDKAKKSFIRGDLFEVVPGQTFYERCNTAPSAIARKLKVTNPSPYSFFINLGNREYLVGASPEMFVRVVGRRIETCPISGTISRGSDAISDSEQIIKLLNSKKDESELTMCSDVDRNDKSRVCEPGSVRVLGRRQIEMYSRLIHTVDHIEGRLREDMDAFDGFLSHAWAVTVTGAPKLWAMRYLEQNEKSPRAWYGGAIGMVHFNGDMNTGLTLRTIRIKDGIAEVRAGATLLYDSNPQEEERETHLKASALLNAIQRAGVDETVPLASKAKGPGHNRRILLVDHEDSFVHTLANYFRQAGAQVITLRTPVSAEDIVNAAPDLVVLSPGPGRPADFDCVKTVQLARQANLPVFGVCLGLQAVAEAYGGKLTQLAKPVHGKPSRINILQPGVVFKNLGEAVTVGRYHSLSADRKNLPEEFIITAEAEDRTIMGIEHKKEPVAAVQFHPESIMTLGGDAGLKMIENVVRELLNH